MNARLNASFFEFPHQSSVNRKPDYNWVSFNKQVGKKGFFKCASSARIQWVTQKTRQLCYNCRNVRLLSRFNFERRPRLKVKCLKRQFPLCNIAPVRPFIPSWKKGLMLFKCSIIMAVISGACLVVLYGRAKAKGFIEANILPSVCSVLGENMQRDVDFGKVKRVSPFSITLESCSIGPRNNEFSCCEVPTIKLCILPLESLRKGKIVVDAILSHPSLLIVQKKDCSWLGIPISEKGIQTRRSKEDGIDYKTKTRRISKEEAGAQLIIKRDELAKKAAEVGYMVPRKSVIKSEVDVSEESISILPISPNSLSSPCFNETLHSNDHHCMDKGLEYDVKHAELENSFGIKSHSSEMLFWSRLMPGQEKFRGRKRTNGKELSETNANVKRRILERSAVKALCYFQSVSHDIIDKMSHAPEDIDVMNSETHSYACHVSSVEESVSVDNAKETSNVGKEKDFCHEKSEIVTYSTSKDTEPVIVNSNTASSSNCVCDPFFKINDNLTADRLLPFISDHVQKVKGDGYTDVNDIYLERDHSINRSNNFPKQMLESVQDVSEKQGPAYQSSTFIKKFKSHMSQKAENIVKELNDVADELQTGIYENGRMFPVTLESVYFKGGTLMLLAYGDTEPRELENVNGYVKFKKNFSSVHVQLSGICKMWRSGVKSEDGGWLSTDVFVDVAKQKWHANLKVANLFVPLFERILEIPITWSKGRASGEIHICMSKEESFPNLHGQLDVTGLDFQIYDAPSQFSDLSTSLCFRGQRIFLHNANGWFGNVPLQASGDFGIHPEEGEFHLMCQIPCVEVNALMRTLKMKSLPFPLAGSITAVFNCQGPLVAPIFVGSGMVSRKIVHPSLEIPISSASEAIKETGAVAAFDRIPLSYVSANFTFNTDNCVAELYGIRASLLDGGDIRGAGNAWICPEAEVNDTALDIIFSGNLPFDKISNRYSDGHHPWLLIKLGDLNGETQLTGSLLRPRFDIKWTAPKAEGSFSDARGDIIISHNYITVNSSSVAFELYMKVLTSYLDVNSLNTKYFDAKSALPLVIEGVELDLRMRGFEFFSLISSYPFDTPRPMNLKSTGRIKFQGKVLRRFRDDNTIPFGSEKNIQDATRNDKTCTQHLIAEVSISGLKLNQLMLAPHLVGMLNISDSCIKLDASGRPDESLSVEIVWPFESIIGENLQTGKLLSFSLQKGQLRANIYYQPLHSANLEVRNLPLDELELASLRGTIQKAEFQLNLQKRRGHGVLSVLGPKFSGLLGESLDVSARWSGDVITIEKTVLEQSNSKYELQGEYVLRGSQDRSRSDKDIGGLLKRAIFGQLGNVISSMGRWRMRLEVPKAQVAEMLPLARLLSHSTDPAVRSRSKDLFIQCLQSVGLSTESLQDLLEVIRGHVIESNVVVLEDLSLPGLAELRGCWHGSLDASGGGNSDTVADFDFHGEDWEWGTYKTQRVLVIGAYSNDDDLRLEKILIQKDNATVHADGTLLGPKSNLHFAVLNFPVSLIPTLVQIIESSDVDADHSLRQLLAPIKGILLGRQGSWIFTVVVRRVNARLS